MQNGPSDLPLINKAMIAKSGVNSKDPESVKLIKRNVAVGLSLLIKHNLVKVEFDHQEWSYFYVLDHHSCFLKLSTSRFIKNFADQHRSEPRGDIQLSILKCIIQKDGSLLKHELYQMLKSS